MTMPAGPVVKIKIDNRIAFKGTLGEWEKRPPDEFKDAIYAGVKPAPWMMAILIAMSDAVTTGTARNITALTKLKGVKRGWSVEVSEP